MKLGSDIKNLDAFSDSQASELLIRMQKVGEEKNRAEKILYRKNIQDAFSGKKRPYCWNAVRKKSSTTFNKAISVKKKRE